LLLSCYTKVKNDSQLNVLLDSIALNPDMRGVEVNSSAEDGGTTAARLTGNARTATGGEKPRFNATEAISILNSAGYTGMHTNTILVVFCVC
jgi:hypothetical protein